MLKLHECRVQLAGLVMLVSAFCANAAEKTPVDLELVLAVDISLSMQLDEQHLQRQGYVAAFRDPALVKAVQSGPQGRIAVTYFEWAGAGIQSEVVGWQIIHDADSASGFADALDATPINRARMTSISGAVRHALGLLKDNTYQGLRRVIDVSGDGPNNSGALVEAARDEAAKAGVTINGLPIMVQSLGPWGGYFEIPNLDQYYSDCVVAGPGAFVIAVRSRKEFATAVRQKLLLEIAGTLPQSGPRLGPGPGPGLAPHHGPETVWRAQFKPPPQAGRPAKYDCLIGEKRWQQFLRDGYNE